MRAERGTVSERLVERARRRGSKGRDGLEAAAVAGADDGGGETPLDGGARGGAEGGAERAIGEEAAQVFGGVGGIGVGPGGAFAVGAVVAVEGDERGADGAAVGGIDEFGGRGPVGGDNGFAEIHRFGDGEAEAFGAVEGDEAIAGGFEGVDVGPREGRGEEDGAGEIGEAGLEGGKGGFVAGDVLDFDDEGGAGGREGGEAEGGDDGAGVFALGVGVEVEEGEEEKLSVGEAEAGAEGGDRVGA